jgi:hypothetical protein
MKHTVTPRAAAVGDPPETERVLVGLDLRRTT